MGRLPQTEPFRRRPARSVVHTERPVLHEVPSVFRNSESDLTPFSGNAGMKTWFTVSAFKIALGTPWPPAFFFLKRVCNLFVKIMFKGQKPY